MSTNDVPGAVASNRDELRQGCWAEHEDGSLIYVYDTEGDQVIYTLIDTSVDPVMDYRDRMSIGDFERTFSCSKADINKPVQVAGKTVAKALWTWHDKTPFPWSRVIKAGLQSVPKVAMVEETLSAAARIAKDLKLRAKPFDADNMTDKERPAAARSMMSRIKSAAQEFMRD